MATASDYMRFLLMIANDGEWEGQRILSPESVELMRTNQLPEGVDWIGFGDDERTGVGFGLGFSVTVEPNDKEPRRPKGRVRLGRRGQHPLLALAARQADRRHDGTTLALLARDGRGAQAGDLWGD